MRRSPRAGRWEQGLRLLAFVFFAFALLGGCAKKPRSLAGIGPGGLPPGEVGDPCGVPNTGCACETDGEEVECGSTVSQAGDMLTCAKGKRVCQDSKWSECLDTHLEEQSIRGVAQQWRPQALGSQAQCPDGYDDCDPYCKYQNDVPDSTVDAGAGLSITDAGLTLTQTGTGGCSSLTIATMSPSTAASLNMAVTGISPTFTTDQTGNKVNFQVTALPNGCIPAPFDVTWTIDKFDRAAVSGTKSNDGAVTLALGVAGPIKVTAYGAGHSASTTINVRVNVVEAPSTENTATTPNRKTTAAYQNLFGTNCSTGAATCRDTPTVGVGASTASFLYPYPATWFPLGLVPPTIQYTYSNATGNAQATKVSLRYPKNNTLADVTAKTTAFNYSLIVAETNNYRQYADCGSTCAEPLDPQVIFAQSVWSAFERTVRGYGDTTADYDADILVQRVKSGAVEQEYRWPTAIHFAGGYLKGTVYYNSYNSTVGGSTATNVVGAVLKINPGSSTSAPTAAIPGSAGKCTICHSVSPDGSTLTFASGDASGSGCAGAVLQGSTYRENVCSFTMPAGTLKKTHAGNTADPYKFIWGAPYVDGSFYVNNTWDNTRILDSSFPSGSGYGVTPGVYRTVDGAAQTAGGVPAAPVTPAFSSDGTMFAYNSGTLNGNIANPAVVVSENQACSVATGVKPSEVSACGQPYGLTLSEVASCPGVTLSEISSCGSSPGGVNVSEISSCGQTPVVNVAEISACNGPTLSEISSCGGQNSAVVSEVSACGQASSVNVAEISACTGVSFSEIEPCGPAAAVNVAEVSACTGPTISEILSCGTVTANGPVISEVEVCGITPNAAGVVISEISPRIQFGGITAGESVELRNDGNAAVNISGWTIRRTIPTAVTVCATIPASTTILPGATYVASYTGTCLQDATGTVQLYNSGGTPQAGANQSHAYTTTVTNQRSVLSCAGVWSESQLAALNDLTNNTCSIESAEIRNDTANTLDISGWTVNNGATLCATVPASTTVAPGAVYRVYTTSGACFTDGGATLTLKNGATTMNTRTYAAATGCSATVQKRSTLTCAQGWSDNVAGADDTSNNACTNFYESVEIRNDTPAALDISSYTVRQGATTCGTVPASTSVAAGAVYRVYTNGNCITDTGSTLTLNNSGGTAIASRVFTSLCTGLVPVRNAMTCDGAWGTALSSANDTTNDACTNTEEVEIRNDTGAALNPNGWTVRAGVGCAGTVCGTLPSISLAPGATYSLPTNSCLADTASTVTLCNGATTVSSHAYSACSPTAPTRSVLSCAGAWTDGTAGATLDTTNDTCAVPNYEAFEIRNDKPVAVDISGWTVRVGATICATVPGSTSLAAGAVYQGNTANGTCFTDAGATLTLNDSGGTQQTSHAYTSTCTTGAPSRSVMTCAGAWSNNNAGGANDTTNDACTNREGVEIRNDTASAVNPGGWLVKAGVGCGGTTCGTVPAGSLAPGASVPVPTTNGACFSDGASSVTLCNGGTQVSTHAYTACTPDAPTRSVLSCGPTLTWTDSVAGSTFDAATNTCAATNFEWAEIRNDTPGALDISGYTLRNGGGTVCATVPAATSIVAGAVWRGFTSTGVCFADASDTVAVYNAGGTLVYSHAYTSTCAAATPRRSTLNCLSAWTDNTAGGTNDTTNDTCATNLEWFEIRNDKPVALDISSWTVRQGATTCATIPSSTSIAAGATYRGYTATGTCFTDAGSTLSLYNSAAAVQAQHAFTSTCTTAAPNRAVMSCGGAWTQNNAGAGNDTTNDICTNTESIDIRNDSGTAVDPTGWTLRAGVGCAGTTCATVAGGSLAAGTTRHVATTNGACFADTASSVTLCNGATQVTTHAYTACTPDAPTRSVFSCGFAWTDSAAGATFDTAADTCANSFEWVEIRNDTPSTVNISSYTVRNNAGTTCFTVPASTTLPSGAVYRGYTPTGSCFTDGGDTAKVYDSGGVLLTSRLYTSTCTPTTIKRGALTCTGTWSNDLTPGANDTTNEACPQSATAEWVEIRNDTPAALNISSWTVRNGGTTCATVPASTTLAAGATWRAYTATGACLPDAGSTLTLNDSGGASQASRAYTSTCTATAGNRSVLACNGARTDNAATAVNDATNDACTNKEGVDIRNDTLASIAISAYTVKNGATTCATVPASTNLAAGATYHLDTTNCLTDGTGTVTLNNGATVVSTKAYNYSCSPAQLRSVLSCAGAWTESVAPPTAAFDTTNDSCAASQQFEAVEIRNDTPATVDISSWTARNGATICATVPASTTVSSGAVYRLYPTSGTCLTDGSGTVTLYNAAGTVQSTQNYTAACGTRATLSCSGTWTNSQAGTGNDSSNDSCAASQSFEWIEIRNDTSASVNVSGWTVKSGATTCITVPNSTTLATGAVYQGYTSTGGCMPDAGGTLSVYDASDNLQSTQTYTSTCSVATPKRGYQPCASVGNTWLNDQAGGTASAVNNSCAFSGSYDSSGTTLRVKDFTCGAAPGSVTCVGSTKTFSNERTVVNCADAAQAGHAQCTRPSYPAFLPNNGGVLYQHQIVDSLFESGVNSAYGATAEIWITKATTKTPVPLDKLNGWNGSSAVTIPTRPRHSALANPTGVGGTYDPNWHPATTTNTSWYYDQCALSTAQTASVREDRLNYFPTVSPQEAGGAYWAIFTSRRLYGNVAVSSPWQVQRSDNSANRFGVFNGSCSDAYAPGSGFIETKKLWVSAIDKSWSGTGDPSHPPFYLPGQELKAGNSHGYWVSASCAAEGAACETADDCCGGTGTTPTELCKITNTSTVPPTRQCHPVDECSDVGEACTATADCCTGLTCPVGGGVCLAVGGGAYSSASYTRQYIATCPSGTRVKWQNFEWQATLPALTEIDFYVQTKALATDTYLPASAALLKKALPPAPAGWDSANVDATLKTNNLASLDYLKVTMTLRPDADGLVAPTLKNWRLVYDCLPAE